MCDAKDRHVLAGSVDAQRGRALRCLEILIGGGGKYSPHIPNY